MSKILSKAQAEAVYSAMCALNNVSMRLEARIGSTHVYENSAGNVVVDAYAAPTEGYFDQAAFAAAYGLQPDAGSPAISDTANLLVLTEKCFEETVRNLKDYERETMGRGDWQEAFRARALENGLENKTWQMGFVVSKCLALAGYPG